MAETEASSLLLDTNAALWFFNGHSDLGIKARELLEQAKTVYVSAVTIWEIGTLVRKGYIDLVVPFPQWAQTVIAQSYVTAVPLAVKHAVEADGLPHPLHNDPADRFLIATARDLNTCFVTSDKAILKYAKRGHLRAINARK